MTFSIKKIGEIRSRLESEKIDLLQIYKRAAPSLLKAFNCKSRYSENDNLSPVAFEDKVVNSA